MMERDKNRPHVLMIKEMPKIHCARGPVGCQKCQEMMEEGNSFCLLKIFLDAGEIARPMTEVIVDNKSLLCEYDVIERFKDVTEVKKYAEANNIEIV